MGEDALVGTDRIKIREVIVVEGRDDTDAVKKSVEAVTIETHGYGITNTTWELIAEAAKGPGIIVFTDPDHAGEQIRRRIMKRFPNAKQAFIDRELATDSGDIGIENADPESIRDALRKAQCSVEQSGEPLFVMEDLIDAGLVGGVNSAEMRRELGRRLGIGYGNGKLMLQRLNKFGITREAFMEAIREI